MFGVSLSYIITRLFDFIFSRNRGLRSGRSHLEIEDVEAKPPSISIMANREDEKLSVESLIFRKRLPEILKLVAPESSHVDANRIKDLINDDKTCLKHRDSENGNSILHRFVENINEKCVEHAHLLEFIIRNGADVNALNFNSETPLHIAAAKNKYRTVRYLIKQNADCNISDNNQDSCLHLAVQGGCVETVAVLHEFAGKALDESKHNKNDITALDIAQKIQYNDDPIKMEQISKILKTDPLEYNERKGYEEYLQRADDDDVWRLKQSIVFHVDARDKAQCFVGPISINDKDAAKVLLQNQRFRSLESGNEVLAILGTQENKSAS